MKQWHDYPVVKMKPCPKCRKPGVRLVVTTGTTIYLQCQACGHHWSEEERRKAKRTKA